MDDLNDFSGLITIYHNSIYVMYHQYTTCNKIKKLKLIIAKSNIYHVIPFPIVTILFM